MLYSQHISLTGSHIVVNSQRLCMWFLCSICLSIWEIDADGRSCLPLTLAVKIIWNLSWVVKAKVDLTFSVWVSVSLRFTSKLIQMMDRCKIVQKRHICQQCNQIYTFVRFNQINSFKKYIPLTQKTTKNLF